MDPQLYSARADLGINLMRQGQDEEAFKQLETCYNNGYQSKGIRNSLKLMDTYKNYLTFKTDRSILKVHKKEAELLRPYFQSEIDALHRHLREEVQDQAAEAGAGGGLSRPRGFRGAHARDAGAGRAGRDVRVLDRDGQPFGPQARELPLGVDLVARDEPRLHPDDDQSSRAALVHRRHRGARRDRDLAGVGRPARSRRNRRHQGQATAAHRGTGSWLHSSRCARSRW